MLSKVLWKSLLVTPALLGATLLANSGAIAAEAVVPTESAEAITATTEIPEVSALEVEAAPAEVALTPAEAAPVEAAPAAVSAQPETSVASLEDILQAGNEDSSMAQVTSISQLSDVLPTDWAYQALQNLVERYDCLEGYPDQTYRGRNFLTRYEFAAGLNACLDRVTEIIDSIDLSDLDTIRRLQEEFAAELATLRGRVDALEARVDELEANQFSTTTKLRGRTIFALGAPFDGFGDEDNVVFNSRVRLNFDTSFTGEDRLRARLEAGNFESDFDGIYSFSTNTDNDGGAGRNDFRLARLEYYFPLGPATIYLEAVNGGLSDIVTTVSSFDDPEQGSISYFGYNPIYDVGFQGIGAGATIDLTDSIQLGGGYLSDTGDDAGTDSGLFNGNYTAFGQLTFTPGPITAALTYSNSYGLTSDGPTSINAYGLSAQFNVSDALFVGGWFSYIDADVFEGSTTETENWTYAGYIGVNDLGIAGSQLGLIVGVPTYVGSSSAFPGFSEDNDVLIDAFYRFPVSDNITLTPGLIYVIQDQADDAVVGTLRTTFSF
ncbi:MAG TPA: iron uptake porin [Chroococcidiopsis sp.]